MNLDSELALALVAALALCWLLGQLSDNKKKKGTP